MRLCQTIVFIILLTGLLYAEILPLKPEIVSGKKGTYYRYFTEATINSKTRLSDNYYALDDLAYEFLKLSGYTRPDNQAVIVVADWIAQKSALREAVSINHTGNSDGRPDTLLRLPVREELEQLLDLPGRLKRTVEARAIEKAAKAYFHSYVVDYDETTRQYLKGNSKAVVTGKVLYQGDKWDSRRLQALMDSYHAITINNPANDRRRWSLLEAAPNHLEFYSYLKDLDAESGLFALYCRMIKGPPDSYTEYLIKNRGLLETAAMFLDYETMIPESLLSKLSTEQLVKIYLDRGLEIPQTIVDRMDDAVLYSLVESNYKEKKTIMVNMIARLSADQQLAIVLTNSEEIPKDLVTRLPESSLYRIMELYYPDKKNLISNVIDVIPAKELVPIVIQAGEMVLPQLADQLDRNTVAGFADHYFLSNHNQIILLLDKIGPEERIRLTMKYHSEITSEDTDYILRVFPKTLYGRQEYLTWRSSFFLDNGMSVPDKIIAEIDAEFLYQLMDKALSRKKDSDSLIANILNRLSTMDNMKDSLHNLYVMHDRSEADMPAFLRKTEQTAEAENAQENKEQVLFGLIINDSKLMESEKKMLGKSLNTKEAVLRVINQGEKQIYSDKDWGRLDVLAKTIVIMMGERQMNIIPFLLEEFGHEFAKHDLSQLEDQLTHQTLAKIIYAWRLLLSDNQVSQRAELPAKINESAYHNLINKAFNHILQRSVHSFIENSVALFLVKYDSSLLLEKKLKIGSFLKIFGCTEINVDQKQFMKADFYHHPELVREILFYMVEKSDHDYYFNHYNQNSASGFSKNGQDNFFTGLFLYLLSCEDYELMGFDTEVLERVDAFGSYLYNSDSPYIQEFRKRVRNACLSTGKPSPEWLDRIK